MALPKLTKPELQLMEAVFYLGDSRIASAEKKARVYDSADDGLPAGSQESSSANQKDRDGVHF
jgi:hypothetical protein